MLKIICDCCEKEIKAYKHGHVITQSDMVDDFGGQELDLCVDCTMNVLYHIKQMKTADTITYYKNNEVIGASTDINKACPLAETVRGHQ